MWRNLNDRGPRKHKTLGKCWFNVGPPSTTLAQHRACRWGSRDTILNWFQIDLKVDWTETGPSLVSCDWPATVRLSLLVLPLLLFNCDVSFICPLLHEMYEPQILKYIRSTRWNSIGKNKIVLKIILNTHQVALAVINVRELLWVAEKQLQIP